jgi:hypothetical protein
MSYGRRHKHRRQYQAEPAPNGVQQVEFQMLPLILSVRYNVSMPR